MTNKSKKENVETCFVLVHVFLCDVRISFSYSSHYRTDCRAWSPESSLLIDENLVYVDHNFFCFIVFVVQLFVIVSQ